jgi:hypothetical protein
MFIVNMVDFIKIRKLVYIGNKTTNKYKNNVQLYVNPYYDETDTITIVDLKDKRARSNLKTQADIHKVRLGKYTYQRLLSSIFSKHTGHYCLLVNVSRAIKLDIIKKSLGNIDKYLLTSNNEEKEPLLMVVINAKYLESLYYE